jgi:hypothetical protein
MGGVDVHTHAFLTSALVAGEWLASRPARLALWKEPQYPLDKRLDEPQNWSEGLEVRILDPTGD